MSESEHESSEKEESEKEGETLKKLDDSDDEENSRPKSGRKSIPDSLVPVSASPSELDIFLDDDVDGKSPTYRIFEGGCDCCSHAAVFCCSTICMQVAIFCPILSLPVCGILIILVLFFYLPCAWVLSCVGICCYLPCACPYTCCVTFCCAPICSVFVDLSFRLGRWCCFCYLPCQELGNVWGMDELPKEKNYNLCKMMWKKLSRTLKKLTNITFLTSMLLISESRLFFAVLLSFVISTPSNTETYEIYEEHQEICKGLGNYDYDDVPGLEGCGKYATSIHTCLLDPIFNMCANNGTYEIMGYVFAFSLFAGIVLTCFFIFIEISVTGFLFRGFSHHRLKYMIVFGSYKESLFRRFLHIFLYSIIFIYSLMYLIAEWTVFDENLTYVYGEEGEFSNRNRNQVTWRKLVFILPYFVLFMFLLSEIVGILGYDGESSIDYVKLFFFPKYQDLPDIHGNIISLAFEDPGDVLNEIQSTISLIGRKDLFSDEEKKKKEDGVVEVVNFEEEVEKLSESSRFGHMNWDYISGLSNRELTILRSFFVEDYQGLKEDSLLNKLCFYPLCGWKCFCTLCELVTCLPFYKVIRDCFIDMKIYYQFIKSERSDVSNLEKVDDALEGYNSVPSTAGSVPPTSVDSTRSTKSWGNETNKESSFSKLKRQWKRFEYFYAEKQRSRSLDKIKLKNKELESLQKMGKKTASMNWKRLKTITKTKSSKRLKKSSGKKKKKKDDDDDDEDDEQQQEQQQTEDDDEDKKNDSEEKEEDEEEEEEGGEEVVGEAEELYSDEDDEDEDEENFLVECIVSRLDITRRTSLIWCPKDCCCTQLNCFKLWSFISLLVITHAFGFWSIVWGSISSVVGGSYPWALDEVFNLKEMCIGNHTDSFLMVNETVEACRVDYCEFDRDVLPQKRTYLIFTVIILVYVVCVFFFDSCFKVLLLLFFTCNKLKYLIIWGIIREWIGYRVFKNLAIFITYALAVTIIVVHSFTFSDVGFTDLVEFLFEFFAITFIILQQMNENCTYDGPSSFSLQHSLIIKSWFSCGWCCIGPVCFREYVLPDINAGFWKIVFSNPDKLLQQSITCLALVVNKKDVKIKKKNSKFAHYDWSLVSKLSNREIMMLQRFFFHESDFIVENRLFRYTSYCCYLSPTRWDCQRTWFCCCGCFCGYPKLMIKKLLKKGKDEEEGGEEEELEEKEKDEEEEKKKDESEEEEEDEKKKDDEEEEEEEEEKQKQDDDDGKKDDDDEEKEEDKEVY